MSNQTYQQDDLLLVNRVADSFTSPYGDVKTNILDSHLIQSDTEPDLTTYPDLVVGTIWIDTSEVPPVLNIWDGTQWNQVEGGSGSNIAEPVPGDLTFSPPVTGGGTQADPFVLNTVTSYTAGGTAETENTITISNQAPFAIVLIDTLTGGIRFEQQMGFCDASGEWTGKFYYLDTPTSTSGDTFDAQFKIGLETGVFLDWQVIQIANQTPIVGGDGTTTAPNASPASVDDDANKLYGTGTGSWADGAGTLRSIPSVTRIGTDDAILFGVDGGTVDKTDKAITDGQTITVIFDETVVDSANDGDRISGAITNDAGFYQEWSMVKKTAAAAWSIDPLVDQAKSDTVVSTNVAISGINAQSQVDLIMGSATLANVAVSVNGNAFDSGFPVSFNPGDTLQFQGDTGQLADEEYVATFSIGGTEATWSVTTVDVGASIVQPTITAPADGTADLVPDVTLVSSAYDDDSTGAGTHTESDWQVYEADLEGLKTDTIDKVTATTLECVSDDKLGQMLAGDHLTMEPDEYTLVTTTIESVGSAANDSQTWSAGLSVSPSFAGPATDAFNGTYVEDAQGQNLFDGASSSGGGGSLTLSINVSDTGPMEILGYPNNFQFSSSNQTVTTDQGFSSSQTFGWIKVADDASTVSTITIQNNSNNAAGLQAVRVGGDLLIDPGQTPSDGNLKLTFPGDVSTNPDLQYFKPGDVVQEIETLSPLTVTSNDGYIYSDFFETGCTVAYIRPAGESYAAVLSPGITVKKDQQLGFFCMYETNCTLHVKINNSSFEVTSYSSAPNPPGVNYTGVCSRGGLIEFTIPEDGVLTKFWVSNGGSSSAAGFGYISLDGDQVIGSVEYEDVTVISTGYPDNNTMVVDGGDWLGSDGSGTADSATTVEFETGSGEADFVSATDETLTIENVTGRWIGENSAGTSFVAVSDRVGGPGAPKDEPPSADYTKVAESLADTTNLDEYVLDDTVLKENKAYYSRVKYRDDTAPDAIESEWSPWNEFATAETFGPPGVGGEFGGGYFAGQINDGGTIYNLIIAPILSDGLEGQLGGSSNTGAKFRTSDTGYSDAIQLKAENESWGGSVSPTLAAQGDHPAFQWLGSSNGPNAGTFDISGSSNGTGIGGFNDWYIPAKKEMANVYYNLKPGTVNNTVGKGADPNAIAPYPTGGWTASDPRKTTSIPFQEGGPQAFPSGATYYWTSTCHPTQVGKASSIEFRTGNQDNERAKTTVSKVRAIRRSPA